MLSVILYGRNDDHGYNYHKRLAISLNCLAELLTDPSDEIIFVDYNSSNELPTIIEAIQDTLSEKAKKTIKLLRVRPHQHARFQTSLPLLEPVARNVAIRRSRPENRWILSTNADMIFVPSQAEKSLTEIVKNLTDNYYSLPRFELPENLWELSLNRLDPLQNILFLREQGKKLHLNTIVRREGFIQFDNPGDFQLMLRSDVMEIGGFDEAMTQGWHVDSNLSKRMSLIRKDGKSLEEVLKGYHCNHTHKTSLQHTPHRVRNDWNQFVMNDAITPIVNGPNWGLSDEIIEEVSLNSDCHLRGLSECLIGSALKDYDVLRNVTLYNKLTYSTFRIFTYLIDHLCNEPKSINLAYVGHNTELVEMIDSYLKKNQFTGKFFSSNKWETAQASLIIFDFGFNENSILGQEIQRDEAGYKKGKNQLRKIMTSFFQMIQKKHEMEPATKVIGININYTDFHVIFLKHLSMRTSCYITGSSYGYLHSEKSSKKTFFSFEALKKNLVTSSRYFVIRYLFKYSDRIHTFALRSRLLKILRS